MLSTSRMSEKKKRILVVEDEIVIADDLCMILKKIGYEPLEPALTYKEALIKLNEPIDLVILDIQLKGTKTGLDIGHHIKTNYDLPFIYLTSFSDQKTIASATKTLPFAYLIKPFKKEDIMSAIEIAFSQHERITKGDEMVLQEFDIPEFTPMERVILSKVSEGHKSKTIAEELFISESTVKNHRHNICVKLDLPAATHSLTTWVMNHKELLKF